MSVKINFIYYLVNRIGPRAASVLMLPLYTRYLNPADYGLIALLAMFGMGFQRLTNIGYDWVLRERYYADEETKRGDLVGATVLAGFLVKIVVLIPINFYVGRLSFWFPGWTETYSHGVHIVSATLIFMHFRSMLEILSKLRKNAGVLIRANVIEVLTKVTVSVVLLIGLKKGVLSLLWGEMAASGAVSAFVAIPYLYRHSSFGFKLSDMYGLLRKGLPGLPFGIGSFIGRYADQYSVQIFLGTYDLGLYFIATRFRDAASMVVTAFSDTTIGDVCRFASSCDSEKLLNRWYYYLVMMMGAMLLPLIVFAKELVMLTTGEEYWIAYKVCAILLVWPMVYCFKAYFDNIVVAIGEARIVSGVVVFWSLLMVIAMPLAVKVYGMLFAVSLGIAINAVVFAGYILIIRKRILISSSSYLIHAAMTSYLCVAAFVSATVGTLEYRLIVLAVGIATMLAIDRNYGWSFSRMSLDMLRQLANRLKGNAFAGQAGV